MKELNKFIIGVVGLGLIAGVLTFKKCQEPSTIITKPIANKVETKKKITKETEIRENNGTIKVFREIIEDKTTITPIKKNWRGGIGIRYPSMVTQFSIKDPVYDVSLERRIFNSDMFGGLTIGTDKSLGLSLKVEF